MKINSNTPFKADPDSPAPLAASVVRKVSFGECDPMGIMWHGNYAAYFEAAREKLTQACNIHYAVLQANKVAMPVKTLFCDYCAPLVYDRTYEICAIMHWTEAARINMRYQITDGGGAICTKGFSVQLITDFSGNLLLEWPPFYRGFSEKWKNGDFSMLQQTTHDEIH